MLATLIIVFREVFEAGLAVGIVAAAAGHAPHALRFIWGGVGIGILGSILMALFANVIVSSFGDAGHDLLIACILIVAVVMLGWHTLWMAREGRKLSAELKALGKEAVSGARPLYALTFVVAAAVLREGSETVLFLYGIVAASGTSFTQAVIGIAGGLALGTLVSAGIYKGLVHVPMRWVFSVTSSLIALVAAGMAAQAAAFLQSAGVIGTLSQQVWNLEAVLPDEGMIGGALHGLVGYSDQATVLMLVVFAITLGVFIALNRMGKAKTA